MFSVGEIVAVVNSPGETFTILEINEKSAMLEYKFSPFVECFTPPFYEPIQNLIKLNQSVDEG